MSKKKQKKDENKKTLDRASEVNGILFILIAIIGICRYGVIGRLISSFSVFLVGTIYPLLLLTVAVIGVYLIMKRSYPSFFSSKLLGLYVFIFALLILLHLNYVTANHLDFIKIIKETIDNVLISFKNPDIIANTGGGIIGAIFSYVFVSLFSVQGTKIVIIGMIVLGSILFLNVSILEIVKKVKEFNQNLFKRKEKNTQEGSSIEEEKKIIISSVDELNSYKEEKEVAKEEEKEVEPIVKEEAKSVSNETVLHNEHYKLPPLSLLNSVKKGSNTENVNLVKNNAVVLEKVLTDFDITGKIVECHIGPSVTQYELEIKAGTKVSKILGIQKEIALALAAKDVRIQAPIPGKNTIGIELPNKVISPVSFKEVMSYLPDVNSKNLLMVALGKDIMGNVKYAEINATPHMLIAGSTGSGKSVCINCIIASILMRAKPEEVKLVMVDPKKVELNMYNGVPHLLCPVVTDPKKASVALKNIVVEMERRYDIFEQTHNKNISSYNAYCETHPEFPKLPYIVVIIDELADLMLVAAKEVEDSIMRITQMARAAGIHLIVATQRPSTDVITGVVKANIPSRISFAVSSSIDSRTILDMSGAEKLLGKGDMLFLPMGENVPIRIQGAYVSEEELNKIVNFVIEQQKASYDDSLTQSVEESSSIDDNYSSTEEYDDPLYNEIVDFAIHSGKISASLIQRKYRLGYNRAARIIDLLEERGIIGPVNGSKPREVLVKLEPKD